MSWVKKVLAVCGTVTNCAELVQISGSLCRAMRADLFVLSIIYDPFGLKGLSFPRPSLQKDYRELMERTRNQLYELVMSERRQGIVAHELVREGKPLEHIVKVIRENRIDLLVLPAHQQSWLENLLTGGYNRTLFRKMPCSILYVKSEPVAVEDEEEEQILEAEEAV